MLNGFIINAGRMRIRRTASDTHPQFIISHF